MTWLIPDDVLIPIASTMQRELGKCCDNFITYEVEQMRQRCGSEYAGVPTDDVRRQAINLRKGSKLGSINGHGPGKSITPSKDMIDYYKSDHWKEFAGRVRELWSHCCAICNSDEPLEVHHRHYKTLNNESLTDVIAVCHRCHKVCDQRRQRESGRTGPVMLFAEDDEFEQLNQLERIL